MNEDLIAEIQLIRKEIELLEKENLEKLELSKLKAKYKKLKFRKEHSTLLNLTGSLEKGTKSLFGSIGTGLKKAGKTLKKSDSWIAEQKRKESIQQSQIKKQKKQKELWEDID